MQLKDIILILFFANTVYANTSLYEQVWDLHYKQLKYTKVKHEPHILCFSCTPGMGRKHLVQQIEDRYEAVKIRTNDIRYIMYALGVPNPDRIDPQIGVSLVRGYSFYFMDRYQDPNQRIILDASVDRSYVYLFPHLDMESIPYTVIRLVMPHDLVVERIKSHECKKNFLQFLPGWERDYDEFAKHYTNYVSFQNDATVPIKELFNYLDQVYA